VSVLLSLARSLARRRRLDSPAAVRASTSTARSSPWTRSRENELVDPRGTAQGEIDASARRRGRRVAAPFVRSRRRRARRVERVRD
jgi:hypothetical protein